MGVESVIVAYCGPPTSPLELWSRWRFDPWVITAFVAAATLYGRGQRVGGGERAPGSAASFYVGTAIAALALLSPLCALSVSLFSARVAQHVLLLMAAAPLVVAGNPVASWTLALRGRVGVDTTMTTRAVTSRPALIAGVFAVVVWAWHSPTLYAATFESDTAYWLMHISLFVCAALLWSALLNRAGDPWERMLAGLASAVQMGLLGALITFAPHPLYSPHFLTTDAWGMVPLQDQQLGGVIMWVPGCGVFLLVALLDMWRALSNPPTVPRAHAR